MTEWILINDRMPPSDLKVRCKGYHGEEGDAILKSWTAASDVDIGGGQSIYVTHWKPIKTEARA